MINFELIVQFLEKLKARPGMYFVGNETYENFEIYLSGYFMGLSFLLKKDLMHEINLWYFQRKQIKPSSILWIDHIKLSGDKNSAQYCVDQLFEEVIVYFQENNYSRKEKWKFTTN